MQKHHAHAFTGSLFALVLLAGCAHSTIRTEQNPQLSLANYRTFSFGRSEQAPLDFYSTSVSPEVRGMVEPQISMLLTQKGYRGVESGADFVVRVGSGVHRHAADPNPRKDMERDYEMHYSEGMLVVDIFDAPTRMLAWHGSALTPVASAPHIDPNQLASVLSQLLARFPPAGAGR